MDIIPLKNYHRAMRQPMKYPLLFAGFVIVFFLTAGSVSAQRSAGAQAGGYARVFEASGKSAAAQQVKQKINVTLRNAVMRSRTRSSSPSTTRRTTTARSTRTTPAQPSRTSEPAAPNYTAFRPDPSVDNNAMLADAIGTTPEEKALLKQLFAATKSAFETEVAAKGRKNDLAAAFTFFIGCSVMAYHDVPEPSEQALDNLWDGLSTVFNESPEFAALSNREKQEMYDMMVAFSGLILGSYMEGKSGNSESLKAAKDLSAVMIKLVLKTDPEKIRFDKNGFVIDES